MIESDLISDLLMWSSDCVGSVATISADTPLFVDSNNILPESLCWVSRAAPPYRTDEATNSGVWAPHDDPVSGHLDSIGEFLGKPSGTQSD